MTLIFFLLMMIPIVVVHELGHYWVGKKSGIKPEVFSIGFGPEIFSREDKEGTKWRFAAIPLGGYVRFAADAQGTNFPNVDPEKPPYAAPFWGKIATVLAGPVFNFMLSFILLFFFASFNGPQSNAPIIASVDYVENSLQSGDIIASVEGQKIEGMDEFYEFTQEAGAEIPITIERNHSFQNVRAPNPNLPVIGAAIPGEPGAVAGLEEGDQILRVNGDNVSTRQDVIDVVKKGESVNFEVLRGDEIIGFEILPEMTKDDVYRIGVYFAPIYATQTERLGLLEAGSYALRGTNWVLIESYKGIVDLITGEIGIEAMSGPVGMSRIATEAASQGFWNFIWLMAMISSAIGFLNLLPIPILDGGHIVLMFYERISGKLPPQFILNFLFLLGIALLMGVLMMTTFNEIFRQ